MEIKPHKHNDSTKRGKPGKKRKARKKRQSLFKYRGHNVKELVEENEALRREIRRLENEVRGYKDFLKKEGYNINNPTTAG